MKGSLKPTPSLFGPVHDHTWAPILSQEVSDARALLRAHREHVELDGALAGDAPGEDGRIPGLLTYRSDGEVTGVALVGPTAHVCCETPRAAERFAASLARWEPRCEEIVCPSAFGDASLWAWIGAGAVGSAEKVDVLCMALGDGMLSARDSDWPAPALRLASMDDLDVALAIWRDSVLESFAAPLRVTDPAGLRAVVEDHLAQAREYVAVDGGAPVFWASCVTSTPGGALIGGIFVPHAARGRHFGLSGTHALAAHLLEEHGGVSLRVRRDNTRAQAIYQRVGFARTGDLCLVHQTASDGHPKE